MTETSAPAEKIDPDQSDVEQSDVERTDVHRPTREQAAPTAGGAAPALPPLPGSLPSTWSARRPTNDDAPAVFRLCVAVDTAVLGRPDVSLEDIRADLASTSAVAERNQAIVLDGDRVLAWAWLEDRSSGRTMVDLFVDRSLRLEQQDALADWAWPWIVTRGREVGAERGLDSTLLDTGLLDDDAWGAGVLERHGFSLVRTWWRMARDVVPGQQWAPAPGVVLRPLDPSRLDDELRTVYDVLETAFVDHWNHHPVTFEEWRRAKEEAPGFDLDLWWVADLDGEPVGALIGSTQAAEDDALYVVSVGTLPAARGRGVAKSLLLNAFAAAPPRGWTRVMLNVDGENPTGATALYRSVGMDVDFAMSAWHRTVACPVQ
jgi:ribosomal protein S18 acetylase RimI-like enzyme